MEAKTTGAGTATSTERKAEMAGSRPTAAAAAAQMVTVITSTTAVEPFKTPETVTISRAISARAYISQTTAAPLRSTGPRWSIHCRRQDRVPCEHWCRLSTSCTAVQPRRGILGERPGLLKILPKIPQCLKIASWRTGVECSDGKFLPVAEYG